MSKEIPTIKGATYVVTPLADGTVTAPDGRIIASFTVGQQVSFAAPGNFVVISDEGAFVDIYFNSAAPAGVGGGRTNNTELHAHLADRRSHLSGDERTFLETVFSGFGEDSPAVPEGALSLGAIRAHFALNAQPGDGVNPAAMTAPSSVFISRVPWARWEGDEESGQWVNNASAIDESVFGVACKLMDNAGLQHECSTDTVEGVDDYNGKLWPFYWQHANYISDEHGIKHVTAIKGVHEDFDSYTKNVCSFGPAFWFFCLLEHSRKEDGTWNTHDGTQNGTPLFQLWGISSRAWHDLDEGRRSTLTALGVSEADFHLWPSAQVWDAESEKLVPRSYWCHSAYCGGYEERENGEASPVSKRNLPLLNNISYNALNAAYRLTGFGGSADLNGFGMLFDIVKNATKDSQSVHKGMCINSTTAVKASVSTASADYLFPVDEKGSFEVGCTVWLWQTADPSHATPYKRSVTTQIGRITAIENRQLTLADGSVAECLCLVFSPETVQPFLVRTGQDDADAIAATKQLTDEGIYAACFATQGLALTGETDVVIGRHDGSCTSNSNGRHPYRVQGTEYMPGGWVIGADTIAVNADGVTSVCVDGTELIPDMGQRVLLQAPCYVSRLTKGTLVDFLNAGYTVVGILAPMEGYILNERLGETGIPYPVDAGGNGASSSLAHGDKFWGTSSPAAHLSGGHISSRNDAGSAALALIASLNYATWYLIGRD